MALGCRRWLTWALVLGALCLTGRADAAAVKAIPALDLARFTGSWFVIEQYHTKFQQRCTGNNQMLYALDDKPGHFQLGIFCTLKNRSPSNVNYSGRRDKFDDGRLKISWLVVLSKKYWVLAVGPNYDWALLGTPNHKQLWVLSRTRTLSPDALTQAQNAATANGFDPSKLVQVQQDRPGYTDVTVASAP